MKKNLLNTHLSTGNGINAFGLVEGLDEVLDGLAAATRRAAVAQLKANNLLGFQNELIEKMQNSEAEYDSLIGFEAGGIKFLVSAIDISGIYDIPSITPVPVSESWMTGVASVVGEVCTVTNFGDFIKKIPVNLMSGNAKLIIPRADEKVAIAVDKITYLTPRSMLKVSKTAQNIQAKNWLLTSYEDLAGNPIVELDINNLLNSDEFLTAWLSQ